MADQTPAKAYKYTVLRQVATPDETYPFAWVVVGSDVTAGTPLDAEKLMAAKLGAGTYSAVSRWAPTALKPLTTFVVDDQPAPVAAPAENAEATA